MPRTPSGLWDEGMGRALISMEMSLGPAWEGRFWVTNANGAASQV